MKNMFLTRVAKKIIIVLIAVGWIYLMFLLRVWFIKLIIDGVI